MSEILVCYPTMKAERSAGSLVYKISDRQAAYEYSGKVEEPFHVSVRLLRPLDAPAILGKLSLIIEQGLSTWEKTR